MESSIEFQIDESFRDKVKRNLVQLDKYQYQLLDQYQYHY